MANTHNPITVLVHGVCGKMGQETLSSLFSENDMLPVAGVDILAGLKDVSIANQSVPYFTDLEEAIAKTAPQVVVDFTNPAGCIASARSAAHAKISLISGSTGLSKANLHKIAQMFDDADVGAILAPNFALGAVLLTRLAAIAAPYFEYADVTEIHHEAKLDAPSGTALSITQALAEANPNFKRPSPEHESLPGTRGGSFQGITIHSSRMPGRLAHHEVSFGLQGQTLSLRHDAINRASFMPGVMLAIRSVISRKGLTIGLDKVMGL
jgi:4-hydroxy-tetrahydrodipicolinate reductase